MPGQDLLLCSGHRFLSGIYALRVFFGTSHRLFSNAVLGSNALTGSGFCENVVILTTFSYSATEKSTSCRSPCMAFLPPSGGVFRLSHLGVIAGYPMQTVMRFSRSNGQNGNKKAVTKQISPALAFSGRSC